MVGCPRGYNGGKKINGRKRHLLVNPQSLVPHVLVHMADMIEPGGVRLVLTLIPDPSPPLRHTCMDRGDLYLFSRSC
jgi:putative transposase